MRTPKNWPAELKSELKKRTNISEGKVEKGKKLGGWASIEKGRKNFTMKGGKKKGQTSIKCEK